MLNKKTLTLAGNTSLWFGSMVLLGMSKTVLPNWLRYTIMYGLPATLAMHPKANNKLRFYAAVAILHGYLHIRFAYLEAFQGNDASISAAPDFFVHCITQLMCDRSMGGKFLTKSTNDNYQRASKVLNIGNVICLLTTFFVGKSHAWNEAFRFSSYFPHISGIFFIADCLNNFPLNSQDKELKEAFPAYLTMISLLTTAIFFYVGLETTSIFKNIVKFDLPQNFFLMATTFGLAKEITAAPSA